MTTGIVETIHSDPALRRKIVDACKRAGVPLTPQALHFWKKLRLGVPPSRVMIVARVLGLSPHEIRPDIFPNFTTPPKQRRKNGSRLPSPTFVAAFANGGEAVVTRMTIYSPRGLDVVRAVRVSRHAYVSRKKEPAPAITTGYFERDGKIVESYTREQLDSVP